MNRIFTTFLYRVCLVTIGIILGFALLSCSQSSSTQTENETISLESSQPTHIVKDVNVIPFAEDEVARISKEELLEKINSKASVLVIDTRGNANYELEHIIGAIHVPLLEIKEGRWEPPLNTEVIIYCG